ncbi:hypothetical protein GCM10010431_83600 [Streptomyces kunmingensis]
MHPYPSTPAGSATSSGAAHHRRRPEPVCPRTPPLRFPGESEDDLRSDHICRGID